MLAMALMIVVGFIPLGIAGLLDKETMKATFEEERDAHGKPKPKVV
jgi:hypothetical protein